MRKIFCLLVIISIIGPNLYNNVSSKVTSRSIKDELFIYEVVKSKIDISINNEDFSVNTFQIDQQAFPTDNDISIFVQNNDTQFVNYSLKCNGYVANETMFYTPDLLDLHIATYFSYYLQTTLAIATFAVADFDEYGDFNSTDASLGMRLEALFFVPPNETIWTIWEDTCEWYNNGSFISTEFFDGVTQCNFELVDDIVLVESWTYGRIKQNHREGYHNQGFLTAYNKTTGVLLGLRSKGTFNGMVLGNYIVDTSSELHLELTGFDLPEFSLYTTNSISTIGFVLTIGSITFLVTIVYLREKKKR